MQASMVPGRNVTRSAPSGEGFSETRLWRSWKEQEFEACRGKHDELEEGVWTRVLGVADGGKSSHFGKTLVSVSSGRAWVAAGS